MKNKKAIVFDPSEYVSTLWIYLMDMFSYLLAMQKVTSLFSQNFESKSRFKYINERPIIWKIDFFYN